MKNIINQATSMCKYIPLHVGTPLLSLSLCHDEPDEMSACPWQAPGVIHHGIICGIEQRERYFRDTNDRNDMP